MLRRISLIAIQSRGVKKQVDIKWKKPPYIAAYKPERSGDLESLPPIPESSLGLDYALSEEIKDAPDSVKKIFSVAHLGQKQYNTLVKLELMGRVKRHEYDDSDTIESRIARMTAHIRCLQNAMEKFPTDMKAKKTVQEVIDKRKKLLKLLRQYDYKKFEWLLEKLNIEYKGHPDTYNKLSRRDSIRKLTQMHCDDIRNKKLSDYRNLLESQQGPYLKNKLHALKFIRSEQIELELPITVTEQDINKIEKQLEEWTVKDNVKKEAKKRKRTIITVIE